MANIEIEREGRLERIFFQLPEECVAGGELDLSYMELFESIERGNPEKKSKSYIENMKKIIAREEFHQRIRHSPLYFNVTHWDLIKLATLVWVLLLHSLLICSSYAPNDVLAGESAYGLYVEMQLNATEYDRRFFEASGRVQVVVDYMCIVNLVLCSLRLFSFCAVTVPEIIREQRFRSSHLRHSTHIPSDYQKQNSGAELWQDQEDVFVDVFNAEQKASARAPMEMSIAAEEQED